MKVVRRGRSTAVFAIALLFFVAAAGCLESGENTPKDGPVTIARVVTIDIDQDSLDGSEGEDDDILERVMKTKYELRTTGSSVDLANLKITYMDKTGATITQSLTDLTTLTELTAGGTLTIPDVDFSGGVIVMSGDRIVAQRSGVPLKSWEIAGVPLGFSAAPGSRFLYAIDGRGTFGMSLNDYQLKTDDGSELSIESARQALDLRQKGTIEVSVGSTAQTVQAEKSHSAYPAPYKVAGEISLADFTLEGKGVHNDTAFDMGLRAENGKLAGEMSGKLWLEDGMKVVKAESDAGKVSADVDFFAWMTGIPEDEAESFPCVGKLKSDNCRIEEVDENLPYEQTFEASSINLDSDDDDTGGDDEGLNVLKRLLQADMGPGDALRVSIKADANKAADGNKEDLPDRLYGEVSYSIEVGQLVDVTTPAGTMKAWEVVEHSKMLVDISRYDKDDIHFKGLKIDQEPMSVKIYLAEKTFTPVKVVYDQPMDLNQMVHQVFDAIEDSTWEAFPGDIPKPTNYEVKLEGGQTMTLDKLEGDVSFQPWAGLFYAHTLQSVAYGAMAVVFAGGFAGLAEGFGGDESEPIDVDEEGSFFPFDGNLVTLDTSKGTFSFLMYPEAAPLTVAHIQDLVDSGFYDGVPFHRYVEEFVVQAGDPLCADGGWEDPASSGCGSGGSGTTVPLETNADYTHLYGAVGLARANDPDSGDSQFYIVINEDGASNLDGSYTVFGYVLEGMDVVMSLREGDTIFTATLS